MDRNNYQNYQSSLRALLNQALVEGLKRNETQVKTWRNYRKAHEKVKKGLEVLPQELTTNCMVPIGPKALMKGKLVHTNEILVCLGEGYFAKYSAMQAIALCDRRIKQADEMLTNLEKEQNLLEMRQSLPLDYDIFGNEKQQEIIEDYDEEAEEEWKIKHRQREKEYRQKLAQLREQEKTEIQSEEDLWQRLDELELEEELEDEIDRLHIDDCNYYGGDTQDDDVSYEEEDCDFSEDEVTDDVIRERLTKLKNNKISKHQKDLFEKENLNKEADGKSVTDVSNSTALTSTGTSDTSVVEVKSGCRINVATKYDCSHHFSMEPSAELLPKENVDRNISSDGAETSPSTSQGNCPGSTHVENIDLNEYSSQSEVEVERSVNFETLQKTEKSQFSLNSKKDKEFSGDDIEIDDLAGNADTNNRRVSFTDKIQVNVFEQSGYHSDSESQTKESESSSESDIENDVEKSNIIEDMISVGADFPSSDEPTEDSIENPDETDDIIRIDVKHSNKPGIGMKLRREDLIEDPSDIYRIFCKPKSILKKSSSDLSYSQNITPPSDGAFDEESNEPLFGTSYTIIVKDVEEKKPEVLEMSNPSCKGRPLSRFKMSRSGMKN